ncbi:hypothetical protein K505DRAFT_121357 [Melanomma pulvis-pyrius CBS 109.77]|uniref:Uncharacterized protein n=1 Tax=Melanomma pulvis-pyrius CBS 109.77 TaxID=1314802 RepID=A0A6A6XPM0_9PLEO|nr:hypothetical protein K505DRAFT_121357 [Melanomma pulvis-pyrius CBS 109.77]
MIRYATRMSDVHQHHTTAWDGVSSILATFFSRTNFLGYPIRLVMCFFSERLFFSDFLCGLCIQVAGPGLFSMFASLGGLHVGHFKDGYSLTALWRAHSDCFCLMSYWTAGIS